MNKWIKWTSLVLVFAGAVATLQAAPSADDKKQIDELKKTYPLATCVVSGEKLETTSMGEPIDYLYKGKDAKGVETTRLVRFCCSGCIKKNAPFASMRVGKLLTTSLKVNRLYCPMRKPILRRTVRFSNLTNTSL